MKWNKLFVVIASIATLCLASCQPTKRKTIRSSSAKLALKISLSGIDSKYVSKNSYDYLISTCVEKTKGGLNEEDASVVFSPMGLKAGLTCDFSIRGVASDYPGVTFQRDDKVFYMAREVKIEAKDGQLTAAVEFTKTFKTKDGEGESDLQKYNLIVNYELQSDLKGKISSATLKCEAADEYKFDIIFNEARYDSLHFELQTKTEDSFTIVCDEIRATFNGDDKIESKLLGEMKDELGSQKLRTTKKSYFLPNDGDSKVKLMKVAEPPFVGSTIDATVEFKDCGDGKVFSQKEQKCVEIK